MTGRIGYPPVYLGVFLLLTVSVAAAMSAVAPPLQATIYTFVCGSVYAAGLYASRGCGVDNEAQYQQLANLGAGLALFLFFAAITISGLETGFVLMVLVLQAGRNLVLYTRRDLNFAYLVSLVLLLYGAGKAMAASFIIFIVLYSLAGMFTFMADHLDARLKHAHGGDVELLTRRMNLPVKGFGLALLTLALALFIYLLVPRPPSPQVSAFPSKSNWNYDNRRWEAEARKSGSNGTGRTDGAAEPGHRQPEEAGRGAQVNANDYAGFRSRFDISDAGALCTLPDALVLNLQTANPFYARGRVFDSFDGSSWQDSGAGAGKIHDVRGRFSFGGKPQPGVVRQVYTVRQDLPPFLFAAYRPVLVSFPGSVIEADAAHALRAPDRLHKGTVYSVASHLEQVDGHPCSGQNTGGDVGLTADRRYLSLYDGISDRLHTLSAEVTATAGSDLERAKAIEAWLRGNYTYTLATVGVVWSGNPVEQFLFELKRGHCELFASSMVVMLRTLGIPARLVTGFYVHRYNPFTGYYEVLLSDGHAWVEAFLEPHGWVTFEPTSSFRLPQCSQKLFVAEGLARYLRDRTEELIRMDRESWWAKLLQGILLALLKIWQVIKLTVAMLIAAGLMLWRWLMREGWLFLTMGAAAAAAGWYLWRLLEPRWRLFQLRRAVAGDTGRFIALCYREMERHFRKRGEPRRPPTTPLEYQQELSRRFPELAGQAELITRHFQQAAYGPQPPGAAEAKATLKAFEAIQGSG